MQSALALSSPPLYMRPSSISISLPRYLPGIGRFTSIRPNGLSVNYNSNFSVFPAEACETIGGDTCAAHMYPEVKPQSTKANIDPKIGAEPFEREYLDYNDPRTVLLGEACDVLGGEFCDQQYQNGICSS